VLTVLAVLPLLVPELWVGFRLGLFDTALSVIAPTEQPLSVRSPAGLWAIGLALAWFGLAYWRRRFAWWEAALVLIGAIAALARMGNAWFDAAALAIPLARQLTMANFRPVILSGLAAVCLASVAATFATTRPPELPAAASEAAAAAAADLTAVSPTERSTVLADWRWAGEVQQRLGPGRTVWASRGLNSESTDFWLDYLRVAQGHARWADLLSQMRVDLLVLDATGQQRQAADLVRTSADWHVTFDAKGVLVAERISP
jgi:hypothetical protein